MTLYETIFARRSVRQYDKAPLGAAEMSEIQSHIDKAKQLPGQSAKFEIVDCEKIKGGTAPHAVLAFAGDSDAAFVNIGYTLQGLDLWLQSIGYGSLWCGMASPREATDNYRIMLGFGKTGVPLRKSESEFKRKKISDISGEDNAIARAVRIAPSAVNFQPWKLTFDQGKVSVASNVRGIGRVLPGKLYLIDLGIAIKHVEIALEYEGKAVTAIEVAGKGKDSYAEVCYDYDSK